MNIKKSLNIKKKEIEEVFGNLNQIKPYKLLKFIVADIEKALNIFTKKEVLEIINYEYKTNILYGTFIQFCRAKINTKKDIKNTQNKQEIKPKELNEKETEEEVENPLEASHLKKMMEYVNSTK
jgi:hypothetical protein